MPNFTVIFGAKRKLHPIMRFHRYDNTTLEEAEARAFDHMTTNDLTTYSIYECDDAGYSKGQRLSTEEGREKEGGD